MSTYALNDFSETLQRVKLSSLPAEVVRAWGESSEGPGCEWSGGFILRLRDGQFAYISGWCDYTGWGCQDGAHVTFADAIDGLDVTADDHQQPFAENAWDEQPADLNRWIAAGMPDGGNPDRDMWADVGVKVAQ